MITTRKNDSLKLNKIQILESLISNEEDVSKSYVYVKYLKSELLCLKLPSALYRGSGNGLIYHDLMVAF